MSSIDESKSFIPLNIAVLTISDTRSLADDKSGTTLADRLTAAGHKLAAREIVTDDVEAIRAVIRRWIADPAVDAVITTGGTGFTRAPCDTCEKLVSTNDMPIADSIGARRNECLKGR